MVLKNGDIVLVAFPFTDLSAAKLRPALIISSPQVCAEQEDYTLLFISSVIPKEIQKYEFLFSDKHLDFKKSGLKKSSVFKANKLATIQKKLIQKKLGFAGARLRAELKKSFDEAIDL